MNSILLTYNDWHLLRAEWANQYESHFTNSLDRWIKEKYGLEYVSYHIGPDAIKFKIVCEKKYLMYLLSKNT